VLQLPAVSAAVASIKTLDQEPTADFQATLQEAVQQNALAIRAKCP
jgi:hypothetical protein